jgi:capsid protein
MFINYVPEYPDQVRGFSQLGASIFDWQDVQDTRRFDLIGRKARASRAMIIHNETGEADETQRMLDGSRDITDNQLVSMSKETLEGGTIEYYKASIGAKIESIPDDRPSTNGMEFDRTITRDALAGIGWSYDFAIDPTKAGGAQMRVVIEKVNRTIAHIQRTLIEPARRLMDNWRINVFMQRGDLPFNDEWMKYRYQVPAKLTADAKYQSQVDITEYAAGFTTHERIAANRSSNWEDDQDQKAREIKRAMGLAESMGIPVEYLLSGVANTNVLTQSLNAQANSENSQ